MTPAEIIVVDPSEGALALASELGAHHAVRADGKHVDAVRELTDGNGAEAIIDFVGEGSAIEDGLQMLRRAGTYHVIGYGGMLNVPTMDIIANEISFAGNLVGTYNDLAELMTLAAQGRVRLETTVYPLDAIGEAIADLDSGRLRGRAILVPDAAA
jgi:NAD+-dependent secondary alcohol dehydrogenase Adh1